MAYSSAIKFTRLIPGNVCVQVAFLKKTATIETTVVSNCMMVIYNIVS